ncbi:MAG: hypothetical protein H8E27_07605 [Verrucomicrobia subdivision 3 bacterium]|nr:hypothetical protein [Limisphaerales bacterium]
MKNTLLIIAFASTLLLGCNSTDLANAKAYPLKTCIVSDNDLKSMGDPVVIVHEGQQIKFCCKPCIKKFKNDPAKFLAKLGQ